MTTSQAARLYLALFVLITASAGSILWVVLTRVTARPGYGWLLSVSAVSLACCVAGALAGATACAYLAIRYRGR